VRRFNQEVSMTFRLPALPLAPKAGILAIKEASHFLVMYLFH
jgi:hypothetical protein